ncbi:hypothetical protein [Pectobacterium brasiliense]|uniref:hypothetical protein n=1 Tax=Pectobacterium brasiliense TaxID=180957 RepID=UPI000582D567|nr:hypothetical protein [Pectobacterium brasiliense]KHT17934.1 hypothetical protein RC95_13670 [Pectobacterium brasiliense]
MDDFLEGELSISKKDNNKTIILHVSDKDKVLIESITFKPLNFEETEILWGEDNQERLIPLKIASCKILNQQALPPEFDMNDKIAKIEIKSSWSLKIIALTIGGWLPAGITPSDSQYLLDKNVFNILNTRYNNGELRESIGNDFFDLISTDKIIINPSLFMLEGNNQSYDRTKKDLAEKYEEAVSIIKKTLPNSIIPHNCEELAESTFGMLSQLYNNNIGKISFIQEIITHLYKETAIKKRHEVIETLKKIAISNNIDRKSTLFIAALSAALSNPKSNPAKKIFKPKPSEEYTQKHAYNALSDFRAIDYLMWATAIDPETKSYLCTNDKNLVRFWCALEPTNLSFIGNRLSFNLKFKESLFGNLNDEEFQWIVDAIH